MSNPLDDDLIEEAVLRLIDSTRGTDLLDGLEPDTVIAWLDSRFIYYRAAAQLGLVGAAS